MADWSKPTITSNYVDFVTEMAGLAVDAITLQYLAPTNMPYGAVRLARTPAVKFQQYLGASSWGELVLSVEGGGTGGATAATARSNLGLGSMAVQQSNAVAITGGTIGSVSMSGNCTYNGGTFSFNGATPGASAVQVSGPAGTYAMSVASPGANGSSGLLVMAGWSGGYALTVHRADGGDLGFVVTVPPGNTPMVATIPSRLVIPVGVDRWA